MTTVLAAACAITPSSRSRPIQTLPSRSAIGAWNRATSGLIAGNSTIGSSATERIVDHLPVRPVCKHVRADEAAQRHERNAFFRGLERGLQGGAGRVREADRAF